MPRAASLISAALSVVLVPAGVMVAMWLRWCWDVNRRRTA